LLFESKTRIELLLLGSILLKSTQVPLESNEPFKCRQALIDPLFQTKQSLKEKINLKFF